MFVINSAIYHVSLFSGMPRPVLSVDKLLDSCQAAKGGSIQAIPRVRTRHMHAGWMLVWCSRLHDTSRLVLAGIRLVSHRLQPTFGSLSADGGRCVPLLSPTPVHIVLQGACGHPAGIASLPIQRLLSFT